MSLFDELKRRNVIRVGAMYAVIGWLILQVADVVLGNIIAPGWVFRAVLLLVILGFPVALLFAWAFELTPQERSAKKTSSAPNPQRNKPPALWIEPLSLFWRLRWSMSPTINIPAKGCRPRSWRYLAVRP